MDGVALKEKVFELTKLKPQLPVHIAAQLKINSTLAGAFLSALISDGKIKYSALKIGGSPLYYAPGHEIKLQSYAKHLSQREKEAYDALFTGQIVKDDELSPVLRVAMRSINDFAIPLRVTTEHESAIYWKWYMLTEQEMHELLAKKLGIKQESESVQQDIQQTSLLEITSKANMVEPVKVSQQLSPEDSFAKAVLDFFRAKGITIVSYSPVKKNAEMESIIKLPTPLGDVLYFCVAKKKKRCLDTDISAGYFKAVAKGLPYLFISTAELPKKVHEFVKANIPQMLLRTLENGNKNQ